MADQENQSNGSNLSGQKEPGTGPEPNGALSLDSVRYSPLSKFNKSVQRNTGKQKCNRLVLLIPIIAIKFWSY